MPGYELINKKDELVQIKNIFNNGSVFFRYGFKNIRNNKYLVSEFEKKFSKKLKSKYALAVSSGTAALRVALAVLNLKDSDEVITQSFTFVATVEAIIESGATPKCVEIDDTLNMDPNDLIKKISKKTKAIILVHMLGSPGRINEILKICKKNKIVVIEDTAWGLGATYKKKYLGTIGRIGTFSFDYAKMITTGEGGMLLFKSKKDFLKAKAWHDHGHDNNPKFPRWQDTRTSSGFNFRMSELQAAVGLAQLKKLDQILKLHKINSSKILNRIKNISEIKIRYIPSKSSPSNDAVIFILPNKRLAKICKINLNKNKISTKILPEAKTWHFCKHWAHMHELEKANKKKLYYSFPKSENILSRCISIPINCKMSKSLPNIIYSIVNKTLLNEK